MIDLPRMTRWLLVVLAAFTLTIIGRSAVIVFRAGKVLLPVMIAADAAPEERAAAEELARGLRLMSGLSWSVSTEESPCKIGFHVGRIYTSCHPVGLKVSADLLAPGKGEVGPDGFRIWSEEGSVFIEGATPEATGFAVDWLLQRHGGVRWYAPGATGEVVPRRTEWTLPEMDEVRQPAYVSRQISGLDSPEGLEWACRNGLRGRLEFSHALGKVFTRETLAANPDWYPQLSEQRYQPELADDGRWQPNLALAEVSAFAAGAAMNAFVRDTSRLSYSLGINDTVRFDQSDATRALVEPLRYFRGMPDYSPLVFTFMNRAAENLAKTRSDRYLGCLAYFWCENVPSFRLNSRVVPYVTTDRSQYYDNEYRAADLALMSRWGGSGVKAFGLWEYAYGQGFLIPRMPLAALASSVREGWQRGARGYMGEVGPQWGFDGFKTWMLAQLLWEPNRTLEDLSDDFYPGYFGGASGPMRQFFECCEEIWMMQPGPPYWLKFYQQEDQALLFSFGQVRKLRALLDNAARRVAAEPVLAARVERTSRAFAVTEAFLDFDAIRRTLTGIEKVNSGDDELKVSARIEDLLKAMECLRGKQVSATEGPIPAMTKTMLSGFMRNDPVPRLLWLAGLCDRLAPRRILAAAGSAASERKDWRALAEAVATGKLVDAPNMIANGSFADVAEQSQEPRFLYPHSGLLPAKWQWRAMPTEMGKVERVDVGASRGQRALRIEGAWDTQFYQWIPVGEKSVFVGTVMMRGKSSPGDDAAFFMTFLDRTGKVVGMVRSQALPKGFTDDWRTMALADRAPDDAAWVGIGIVASRQSQGDWLEVTGGKLQGVFSVNRP